MANAELCPEKMVQPFMLQYFLPLLPGQIVGNVGSTGKVQTIPVALAIGEPRIKLHRLPGQVDDFHLAGSSAG